MTLLDTEAWMSILQYYPITKGLAIDPMEQNIYTASFGGLVFVIRIRASDGGFVSSQDL